MKAVWVLSSREERTSSATASNQGLRGHSLPVDTWRLRSGGRMDQPTTAGGRITSSRSLRNVYRSPQRPPAMPWATRRRFGLKRWR